MMEQDLLKQLIDTLGNSYGPYAPFIVYLLYTTLKEPIKNFIENLRFKDIISFRKHKIQAKRLQSTMISLQNAINKEREVGEIIDNLRDKYDFKYTYVSIYSNGESDLLGMGKYKYSIEYEKSRHDTPSIRYLYQNQSLIPYFPLISTLSKNAAGDIVSFEYKTSLIEVNLEEQEENHPLKHKYYMHGINKVYVLVLLKEIAPVKADKLKIEYVPIGDLLCAADEKTQKISKEMLADLYLAHKNIYQILDKYSEQQPIKK